jgi:uncharacterized coiled-coil DUF342 family protein
MPYLPAPYISLLLIVFYLLPTPGLAEQNDDHKQQLQSILQELNQASKQRQQHNAQVKKLTRRLECNWTLIRAYEVCGQLHKNAPEKHLKCSATAKQNAAQCLENAAGSSGDKEGE